MSGYGLGLINSVNQNALKFPNGSAATPGLSLVGATTSGLYIPSSNELGFSSSGTNKVTIDSSGVDGWKRLKTIQLPIDIEYIDGDGTKVLVITSTPHGLIAGSVITIANTTNYNAADHTVDEALDDYTFTTTKTTDADAETSISSGITLVDRLVFTNMNTHKDYLLMYDEWGSSNGGTNHIILFGGSGDNPEIDTNTSYRTGGRITTSNAAADYSTMQVTDGIVVFLNPNSGGTVDLQANRGAFGSVYLPGFSKGSEDLLLTHHQSYRDSNGNAVRIDGVSSTTRNSKYNSLVVSARTSGDVRTLDSGTYRLYGMISPDQAQATVGSWTLLSTTATTAATAIDIGFDSGTYDSILIRFSGITVATDNVVSFRFGGTDSVIDTGSNYNYMLSRVHTGGSQAGVGANGVTLIDITGANDVDNATTYSLTGSIQIIGIQQQTDHFDTISGSISSGSFGGTNLNSFRGHWFYEHNKDRISAIRFICSANFGTDGIIKVYGRRDLHEIK